MYFPQTAPAADPGNSPRCMSLPTYIAFPAATFIPSSAAWNSRRSGFALSSG